MNELKYEYISIYELKPYKRNARIHPQEQVNELSESIYRLGFNDPVGVWKDNTIAEGHGRILAMKQLDKAYPGEGFDKVPCVRLDHLDKDEFLMYMQVHNQSALNSDWDETLLSEILLELKPKFDLLALGLRLPTAETLPNLTLERQSIGTGAMVKNLSFGGKNVAMTEEEASRIKAFFKAYTKKNGNALGLVSELLDYGAKRYEN